MKYCSLLLHCVLFKLIHQIQQQEINVNKKRWLLILLTLKKCLNVPLMHLKCIFYLLRSLSSSRQSQPWILRGHKYKHDRISLLCLHDLTHRSNHPPLSFPHKPPADI